jgi:hypothetical protein
MAVAPRRVSVELAQEELSAHIHTVPCSPTRVGYKAHAFV